MGANDTYAACVAAYLRSEVGCGTSEHTARQLYALGPGQLGMSVPPSERQLHNTRRMLEELDVLAIEQSGAWRIPRIAIACA